tara:strand:+ start:1042 stop:1638 length:597 start_codon:yes stop_codon:yes gene_type:complete
MSSITTQIESQYTNLDNEELNKNFSGSLLSPPKEATFSQSREVAMENLKNQYMYYLRRYEAAYGQLMVNKDPSLLGTTSNQNSEKVAELEKTVTKLNNTLKTIVQAIARNNNNNDKEIQDILKQNSETNFEISKDAQRLDVQKAMVNDKYQNLASEAQMMVYGSTVNRNKTHIIWVYSILCVIAFFLFIGLFVKLSKK